MNAALPSRLRASFCGDGVDDVEAAGLVGRLGLREADPDHEATRPVDHVHDAADTTGVLAAPARAAEVADRDALGDTGHVRLVVVPAEGEDDGARAKLLDPGADLVEPVVDVGTGEAGRDASVDPADRLDHGARPRRADDRVPGGDHERVSGDPELQLPVGRERDLLGVAGGRASASTSSRRRLRRGPRRRGRRLGRAISVSISSLPDRPMSAWTPMRGRSSSRAWLTSASGPVKAIVTSRYQPSGLL